MSEKHKLDDFKASISAQGPDKHIHLPRKMYKGFEDKKLLNKKFIVSITLTEI